MNLVIVALNGVDDESATKAFLAILLLNVLFNDISSHSKLIVFLFVLLACVSLFIFFFVMNSILNNHSLKFDRFFGS